MILRGESSSQLGDVLECLDAAIAKKNLLKHPFYRDWQKGILTRLSLQTYAAQYYCFVKAFPDFLLRLAMRTGDELRGIVLIWMRN
jgi:pyrroloquinoline quinone (PQQ) biosynthesis protein C